MTEQRPLTILNITLKAVLGGVTRHIADLGAELTARGHRVLAAGAPGPWRHLLEENGIAWRDLPLTSGPLGLWRAAGTIAQIVRQERVDLLHCHFRRPVLAARLARWRGTSRLPVVFTLHLAPIPVGGVQAWLSDWGDMLIAPSEAARAWITTEVGVPPERVVRVPHSVDPARWPLANADARRSARRQFSITDNAVVAAFVGRFQYPKNEEWILDVAAECRQRGMNAVFILCGDGPHGPSLRERAQREGLSECVRFVEYGDPLPVYQAADLLLLPSSIEGFAYVAAEAASCGAAVLRTRTAGWHETVNEGVTGAVVEIDRAAFVQKAVEMLSDPPRLRQMGAAGAELVRRTLQIDRQVLDTIDVYRRAMTLKTRGDEKTLARPSIDT